MDLHVSARALARCATALAVSALLLTAGAGTASAASSKGCEGGGFAVTGLANGVPVGPTAAGGSLNATIPASNLGRSFLVKGKYVEFTVVSASFAVENWTFTGAANPLDLTGGRRTVVYASKTPDHRGLTLTSGVSVELTGTDIVVTRTGTGLSMKLQAKDCATGGIFQMEPQRGDGTTTRVTHVLAGDGSRPEDVFYFDNPNFRAREGDTVPFKDTTVTVAARINFANDVSPNFVGRDSPQVATRVTQGCPNTVPAPKRPGGTASVDHCGGISVWDVASGGRMGQVMGEDSTEVAPPPTNCTTNCQAQNRVRGQAVVLGFPFPVPAASRLKPRFP
jgi:hypothetical protein